MPGSKISEAAENNRVAGSFTDAFEIEGTERRLHRGGREHVLSSGWFWLI